MLYGILIALSGGLSGVVVAMYYRYKYAMTQAEVVGLKADVATVTRDRAERDAALAKDLELIATLNHDHADQLNRQAQLLEAAHADVKGLNATIKVLRTRDPAGVAAALGGLFPAPQAHGDQGGTGRTSGGGAGPP